MSGPIATSLIAYGFATVFAIFVGALVAVVLWLDRRRISTVILSAGAAAGAFMTLATAVVDHFVAL